MPWCGARATGDYVHDILISACPILMHRFVRLSQRCRLSPAGARDRVVAYAGMIDTGATSACWCGQRRRPCRSVRFRHVIGWLIGRAAGSPCVLRVRIPLQTLAIGRRPTRDPPPCRGTALHRGAAAGQRFRRRASALDAQRPDAPPCQPWWRASRHDADSALAPRRRRRGAPTFFRPTGHPARRGRYPGGGRSPHRMPPPEPTGECPCSGPGRS